MGKATQSQFSRLIFQLSELVIAFPSRLKNADGINGWIRFAVLVNGYNSTEINTMPLKLPVNTGTLLRF